MKYAAFILLIAVISCSKSTTTQAKLSGSMIGKWIQTAYLADPGDGSGTWQPDNTGSAYIIFNETALQKVAGFLILVN